MTRLSKHLILILITAVSVRADVAVNEVLSNEPGSSTSLEWIELYNDAGSRAELAFYELYVTEGTTPEVFPLSGSMEARSYLVLCRNAVRFEEHWGDSSGVWGDALPLESYPIQEYSFQLNNDAGLVEIYFLQTLHSSLAWDEPGDDGRSWERFHPDYDTIMPSQDITGSTPGRFNSISPLNVDLALESVEPWSTNQYTNLAFEIVNRGLTPVDDGILELYYFDPNDPDSAGAIIAGETIGEVDSGGTVILIGQYQFPGVYQRLVAQILSPTDERTNNNRWIFTAPGSAFPPLVINEFMADPVAPLYTEWIEFRNSSAYPIDLAGWQIGDETGLTTITNDPAAISPGEYAVVAENRGAFLAFYPAFDGLLLEPTNWRDLNNSSDSVRLVDNYGLAVDATYYSSVQGDNHTWSLVEAGSQAGAWGRSESVGGSPGAPNEVRITPEVTETLSIAITPRIISPDGNGVDDEAVIEVTSSPASAYTLKIYDAMGRLVKTLDEDVPDLLLEYRWDGTTNAGERAPIGIYVLYFEAVGVESLKKTIVVAR
jgi:hypothetical protein